MFAIVGALGLLVVGVSLAAVPTSAPAGPQTRVDGVFAIASPSPAGPPAATASPRPAQPSQPAPIAPAPITISGPGHIAPWTTADYAVTFTGTGSRPIEVWWTGAAMGNWTWQRLDGHCELTPSRDRLSGTAVDRVVVQLQLTPSGAPGGQLLISGREAGGTTYALAVITVG